MTQVFRMMFATAAITLAISVQSALAQQQPAKKSDQTKLSEQRESVMKKGRATAPATGKTVKVREEKHKREHTIVDLPGYPRYITTGNPQADEQAYQRAKATWIKENPQIYKNYLRQESEKSKRPSVASRRAANPKN